MDLFTEANDEVIAMGSCSDIYHTECIKMWVTTCIDTSQLPIICPEPKCKLPIPLPDLRDLLTVEQMDRCQRFEWKKIRDEHADMNECPTEGCDYIYLKESEE